MERFCGRCPGRSYHRRMARRFFITLCSLVPLVAASCSPVPLLQDAGVVRHRQLKSGVAAFVTMPVQETYFEPDGPGVSGDADRDLQYMPLVHAAGWTRYGLGHDLECTTAVHVPSFAIALGVKWAAVAYEPGDVASLALSADVGGSFVIPSFIVGLGVIGSFHLDEAVSLDLVSRLGSMPGLWNGPALTSTVGVSIGRTSTIRLAAGYTVDLSGEIGLGSSAPALFVGGGWEH